MFLVSSSGVVFSDRAERIAANDAQVLALRAQIDTLMGKFRRTREAAVHAEATRLRDEVVRLDRMTNTLRHAPY